MNKIESKRITVNDKLLRKLNFKISSILGFYNIEEFRALYHDQICDYTTRINSEIMEAIVELLELVTFPSAKEKK